MIKPRIADRLTVLSAFTGAAGLDLGLEAAGFDTIACIERDPAARASIAINRPSWTIVKEPDVVEAAKKLTPGTLGLAVRELALLAGGPPCQPFSKAAQWADRGRTGLADPRSRSLSAFLTLTERFLPKVLLIENVEGFCGGKTSAVPMLNAALAGLNKRCGTAYALHHFVLDAADYGVAQHRRRAILIACREGEIVPRPAATSSSDETRVRAFDALFGLQCEHLPTMSGKWAALLPSIPEGCNYQHHTEHGAGLPIFGFRTRFWSFLLKLAQDRPAWTISAQPGPATGPFHWNNRPLTTKELLRLQSFPAHWQITGNRQAQVRQVGNATPPLLAEIVGRQIATHVFRRVYDQPPSLSIQRQPVTATPTSVAEVPEKYRVLARAKPKAHPGEGRGPGATARKKRAALAKRRATLAAKKRGKKPRRLKAKTTTRSRNTRASLKSEIKKVASRARKRESVEKLVAQRAPATAERRSPRRGSPSSRAA